MIGAVGRSFLLLPTRSRLKRMTMPGIILLQTGQGTSNELRGEEQTIDRAQPVRPCSSACCSGPGCGWITKTIMTSTRVTYTSLSECVREVRAWTRIESVGLSVESTRVAFFFFFFSRLCIALHSFISFHSKSPSLSFIASSPLLDSPPPFRLDRLAAPPTRDSD